MHSASQTWCGSPKTNEIWLPLFHDTLVNGDICVVAFVAQQLAQLRLLESAQRVERPAELGVLLLASTTLATLCG